MKEKYLDQLNEALKYAFSNEEARTITNDYKELFEDYLASGLTEEEIIKKLGEPKEIVKSLIEEGKRVFPSFTKVTVTLPKRGSRKIINVMPFLSLLIYLVLGYVFKLWHPGWLVFLLIPISGVLFSPYRKKKLVGITPFLAVIVFTLVGMYVPNGFRYSWIAFIFIPLIGSLS